MQRRPHDDADDNEDADADADEDDGTFFLLVAFFPLVFAGGARWPEVAGTPPRAAVGCRPLPRLAQTVLRVEPQPLLVRFTSCSTRTSTTKVLLVLY